MHNFIIIFIIFLNSITLLALVFFIVIKYMNYLGIMNLFIFILCYFSYFMIMDCILLPMLRYQIYNYNLINALCFCNRALLGKYYLILLFYHFCYICLTVYYFCIFIRNYDCYYNYNYEFFYYILHY